MLCNQFPIHIFFALFDFFAATVANRSVSSLVSSGTFPSKVYFAFILVLLRHVAFHLLTLNLCQQSVQAAAPFLAVLPPKVPACFPVCICNQSILQKQQLSLACVTSLSSFPFKTAHHLRGGCTCLPPDHPALVWPAGTHSGDSES